MPRRQLPHQTPRPRPFARRERITGQGTAGLIRPTLLLSIMTVDKTLVRNYDEYLARAMAKEQGIRFAIPSPWPLGDWCGPHRPCNKRYARCVDTSRWSHS
jgi:hypothetical protein